MIQHVNSRDRHTIAVSEAKQDWDKIRTGWLTFHEPSFTLLREPLLVG